MSKDTISRPFSFKRSTTFSFRRSKVLSVETQQIASEEDMHALASEKAQQSSNKDSDNPVRNGEDDALSLFQGHDLKEESDRSFNLIL